MKHFEASGLWFTNEDPEKNVAGTLHYSSSGLLLRLIGSFKGGWISAGENYDKVYGVVSECPYGPFATLFDCLTKSSKLNFVGVGAETIFSHWAVIGTSHYTDDSRPIEAADFRFSYLTDWVGSNRFDVRFPTGPGEKDFSINYRRSDSLEVRTREETFVVGVSMEMKNSRIEASIHVDAHLIVKPATPIGHRQILDRYLNPLRDLLTFATDHPNQIEELTFSAVRNEEQPQDLSKRLSHKE